MSFFYWQVVLLVGAERVVDVSLQVDGQVGDPEHWPGNVNQPVNKLGVTLPAQKDNPDLK